MLEVAKAASISLLPLSSGKMEEAPTAVTKLAYLSLGSAAYLRQELPVDASAKEADADLSRFKLLHRSYDTPSRRVCNICLRRH